MLPSLGRADGGAGALPGRALPRTPRGHAPARPDSRAPAARGDPRRPALERRRLARADRGAGAPLPDRSRAAGPGLSPRSSVAAQRLASPHGAVGHEARSRAPRSGRGQAAPRRARPCGGSRRLQPRRRQPLLSRRPGRAWRRRAACYDRHWRRGQRSVPPAVAGRYRRRARRAAGTPRGGSWRPRPWPASRSSPTSLGEAAVETDEALEASTTCSTWTSFAPPRCRAGSPSAIRSCGARCTTRHAPAGGLRRMARRGAPPARGAQATERFTTWSIRRQGDEGGD